MKKNKQAELILKMSSKELTFHLLVTQLLLFILFVIFGILLFKDFASFFGLFRMDRSVITLGAVSGIVVVLIDVVLMKVLPEKYYDDGGINEKIFSNRSVAEIAFLAMVIAICEELLFRGVIQTHFGLFAASVIFALVHIRYWGHWFLIVNIVMLSFWIGIIYQLSNQNLLVTIFMHFIVDFLLGWIIRQKHLSKKGKGGIDNEKEPF